MTLTEFLLARIAEDQDVAETAMSPGPWKEADEDFEQIVDAEGQWAADTIVGNIRHMLRWQPARVLAECDAKRRIVELHVAHDGDRCSVCYVETYHPRDPIERGNYPCDTLRILALPYADHPDYREEWKP